MSKEKLSNKEGVPETISTEWIASMMRTPTTRRKFLKITGVSGLGMIAAYLTGCSALGLSSGDEVEVREINVEDAMGMILAIPNRCVGCRRCELACTEYNEGYSQPSLARVNIRRNWAMGPRGAQLGLTNSEGRFGNHRIVQETCRQCAHPTPCALACPYDAIETIPPVNARVVNTDKCEGCRMCQDACPWGMTTFNEATNTSTKCFLCNNAPQCVAACPTGALRYVPWEDMSKIIPPRFVVTASIKTPDDLECQSADCHPTFGK